MASIKVELLGDATSLERAFSRAARSSLQLKVGLGSLVKSAAVITGVSLGIRGLSEALVGGVRASTQFQASLQKMIGLSGVAQNAIKGLRKDVLQLAPSVGKGPQELAEALFFITSSGIPAAKALDVLTVSAKASASGLGETKVVADAVTSALNAYGPAAITATKATDVLVATVREGKGEATDFAGVIGNVAAIASELGVSFDQVGAALAAQTRLGTDAQTSAIQLQQVFSALLSTSPQVAEAFENVGLNIDTLRKQLSSEGLLSTLTTIKSAFGDSTAELRKAIPEIRAFRGVLSLVGKQAEPVRGIFERLAKSTGSLGTAFDAISKTQAQQFAKLNASLEVFRITLGSALAPAILKIIGPLNKWLGETENQERVQREITRTVRDSVGVIRALVDVLKPLVSAAKDTSDALGGLRNTVKLLATAFVVSKIVNYASAIAGVGTQSVVARGQVLALRTALLRLGAIGLITLGVEVIINRDAISKKVDGFLRGHGLGFLATKKLEIGTDVDLATLEAARKKLHEAGQDGSVLAKALDKVIAKLQKVKFEGIRDSNLGQAESIARANEQTADKVNKRAIDKARETGRKSASAAKKAFELAIGRLEIKFASAQQTKTLKDDLVVLNQMEQVVRARLAVTKNDLDLQRQLVDIHGEQLSIQEQIAEAAKEAAKAALEARKTARQSAQFQALNLTATGEKITPSVGALKKRLGSLQDSVKGTVLDTKKTRNQLRSIARVLSGAFGAVGKEVRSAILQMLNDIAGALEDRGGKFTKTTSLNSKKLLEGLDLSGSDSRLLKARLSNFNSGGLALAGAQQVGSGGGLFVVEANTTVNLDGQKVASNTTKHQQKAKRRNPQQKRGPHRR